MLAEAFEVLQVFFGRVAAPKNFACSCTLSPPAVDLDHANGMIKDGIME